jgi:hypothetical protein
MMSPFNEVSVFSTCLMCIALTTATASDLNSNVLWHLGVANSKYVTLCRIGSIFSDYNVAVTGSRELR